VAHIQKRASGRWRARYRGPDGNERSRTFRRRADAERFLATVEADKLRGYWVDPMLTKVRFGEYATEWLGSITHVRPTTRINIESRLRRHILPKFGAVALGSIRPGQIRTWIADLSAEGLSPGSVASIYRTLSKILKTAEIDGFIARTPCIGIELPREHQRGEMHFLSHDQVAALADALEGRYRALIYRGLHRTQMGRARCPQNRTRRSASRIDRGRRVLSRGEWPSLLRSYQDRCQPDHQPSQIPFSHAAGAHGDLPRPQSVCIHVTRGRTPSPQLLPSPLQASGTSSRVAARRSVP
jgi:hypothetical protein